MGEKLRHMGASEGVPPGFALAQAALIQFHEERVVASDVGERNAERTHVTMVIAEALAAGTLVVFVCTQQGEIVPVPIDVWRPYLLDPRRPGLNLEKLHKSGVTHEAPLMLSHESFDAKGIAVIDLNNWAGFSKYADRWPPYKIPASLELLLKFCENKEAISEGLPLQKLDALEWFRLNWPASLEDRWPLQDRKTKIYDKADKYPAVASEFANVVLSMKERAGGNTADESSKLINDRRKRMAPNRVSDADFEAALTVVDE